LYDNWWKEEKLADPTGDHPLWAIQSTNARSGSSTWRCKECHGWDYKGKGGAYSSGSHYTGFPCVITAGATMSKEELMGVMQGSTDYRYDFSTVMGEHELEHLVDFLSEGLINDTMYIDYATAEPLSPNASNGAALYAGTCVMCHGADGKQILIDGELSIGDVARDEPAVEILHKIRVGQPGTLMPSAFVNGWSVQDAADVLAHIMALP
jgi:thiosulfate dehydrogenase